MTTPFWSGASWNWSLSSSVSGDEPGAEARDHRGAVLRRIGVPRFGPAFACCTSSGSSPTDGLDRDFLAVAPEHDRHVLADLRIRHDARQGAHLLHVLAVELQDDVAVADLRLLRRARRRSRRRPSRRSPPSAQGFRRFPASPAGCCTPSQPRRGWPYSRNCVDDRSSPCWTGSRSRCRSSRPTASRSPC